MAVAYLVTGNPGSGKSTVADELTRRGFTAIDPDHDAALSYWEDEHGGQVLQDDGPAEPGEAWLRWHRWVWSRPRMERRIAGHDGSVFVCGIALNIDQFLDVFSEVFLLRIDDATQEARLRAHDAAHPPGRTEAGRKQIRDGRSLFESHMLDLGAVALDGTAPPGIVTDEILRLLRLS